MSNNLRFNVGDERLKYTGHHEELVFDSDRIIEFNHRHKDVLARYELDLTACALHTLGAQINKNSNLGALRNRQVRQSIILSAAASAIAVGLHGRGALNNYPKEEQTKALANHLKRANDRTSAQIMAEVLQNTTETLPIGEEILIESAITEGVRVKPGKEAGGNPTVAVGAVFGKREHRSVYGLEMPRNVTMLSMGNDVIEGTTKSVKGIHSSMTALFVTESNIKRHLPDIYVQRWMSGAHFEEFNPRDTSLADAAEIISDSMNLGSKEKLSAYFLDRPRHYPAMDALNKAGVATPFDKDGDLLPAALLGLDGLNFPNGRGLNSMIGEIGGSAEWAVGVLPLVWRGGSALGMLTSQSSLTRKDLSPEELWKERFHFTEDEFMQIQDARFERKPYFMINDIIEDPHAGGIAAFGAITDNYFLPYMNGVTTDPNKNEIKVSVLTVTSMGLLQVWEMCYRCRTSLDQTTSLFTSPKEQLEKLDYNQLESAIDRMLAEPYARKRFRIFFNNEYYPALIPVRDQMVFLHKALETLIERGALASVDRDIVEITERLAREWFVNSD